MNKLWNGRLFIAYNYTAKTLTQNEIDTLALSCFTLTTELATRFLDDYILGNPYFKINYPELQIATFCGQQGRIPRTVRAILSGQF